MMDRNLALNDVRRLLLEYDRKYGTYPEPEYGGYDVWRFVQQQLQMTDPNLPEREPDEDPEGVAYSEANHEAWRREVNA